MSATTTPDLSDVTALAREANRLCRLKYSEAHQHHLFEQWCRRIDRAQQLWPTAMAVDELQRLISLLRR